MEVRGKMGKETLLDCLANGYYRGFIYRHREGSDCLQYAGKIYRIVRSDFKNGEERAQIEFVDAGDPRTVEVRTSCLLNDQVFRNKGLKHCNGKK